MNWRLFGRYVFLSVLMIGCTFGLAIGILPAIWWHEWWPEIRRKSEAEQV